MPNVFACLAIANVLLILGSGAAGLFGDKFGTDRHVLLSVLTLLFSCFVQVVTFTYLTVTGKMIGQAVHLGRLDETILQSVKSHKKVFSRNLAVVFVAVVLATATGASGWRLGSATVWHQGAALVLLAAHTWAFVRQYEVVFLNAHLVEKTLGEYEKTRDQEAQSRGTS